VEELREKISGFLPEKRGERAAGEITRMLSKKLVASEESALNAVRKEGDRRTGQPLGKPTTSQPSRSTDPVARGTRVEPQRKRKGNRPLQRKRDAGVLLGKKGQAVSAYQSPRLAGSRTDQKLPCN